MLVCALLAASHLAALLAAIGASGAWQGSVMLALCGLLVGIVCADFGTGIAHWTFDTYGNEQTPLIGAGIISSFREHHRDQQAMLAHDTFEVNGQPAALSGVLYALLALPEAQGVLRESPFLYAWAWSLLGVGALGNQLHLWAHQAAAPPWVRALQRVGVILSPHAHGRHHRGAHDAAYCIATGWCNATLDALGFWRTAERAVSFTTGLSPSPETEAARASHGARPR